jgi:hypothetical protein
MEILLMEITSITILYSSIKKRERDKIENILLGEIETLGSESNINLKLLEEKMLNLKK